MATFVSGNIFVRANGLQNKGDNVFSHKHDFDHTTIVFKGSIHVKAIEPNGSTLEYDLTSPSYFLVEKGVEHEITALEDNTEYWCVYSHHPNEAK